MNQMEPRPNSREHSRQIGRCSFESRGICGENLNNLTIGSCQLSVVSVKAWMDVSISGRLPKSGERKLEGRRRNEFWITDQNLNQQRCASSSHQLTLAL